MDLIEFRRSLRRHRRSSLLAAIIVLILMLLATRGTQITYSATSSVLVTPRAEKFQGASDAVLRVIYPNVVVLADSETLRNAAAPHVPEELRDVPFSVDASLDDNAGTLYIAVKSNDANAAAAWSAALARALGERMKNDPYLATQVLDTADGATLTGSRVRVLSIAISVGLALFAFVLTAFAAQRLEESRDTAAALRRRGVRVLGSIGATRRHARHADGTPVVLAGLLESGPEHGVLFVSALGNPGLAPWLVAQLHAADVDANTLDVRVAPSLAEMQLSRAAGEPETCVLVADDRASSVNEIINAAELFAESGIECRGVVLARGVRHADRFEREELRATA